jgi:hypothetical protein
MAITMFDNVMHIGARDVNIEEFMKRITQEGKCSMLAANALALST